MQQDDREPEEEVEPGFKPHSHECPRCGRAEEFFSAPLEDGEPLHCMACRETRAGGQTPLCTACAERLTPRVYVPSEDSVLRATMPPACAIVGTAVEPDVVAVDYETDLERSYAERLEEATRCHQERPFGSAIVPAAELIEVGTWDGRQLHLRNPPALQDWLGRALSSEDLRSSDERPPARSLFD